MEDGSKLSVPPSVAAAQMQSDAGKQLAETLRNVALNAALSELDAAVKRNTDDPSTQMGILMVAQALAFRRVLAKVGPINRGKRYKLMRLALHDFEEKLTRYAIDYREPAPEPAKPEPAPTQDYDPAAGEPLIPAAAAVPE